LAEFGTKSSVGVEKCPLTDMPIEVELSRLFVKQNASVVVMGAGSRLGLDRVLTGSPAERLLNLSIAMC